jgi:uncharacterized protein (TIGR02246 family)
MSDEQAVRAVCSQVIETWNAHDMKAFAELFRADAEFVNVYGMWWTGHQRIQAEHEATHATVFRQSRLSAGNVRVKFLRPDVASLHVLWELTGLALPDGQALPDRKGVLVYILVKDAGEWRIAVGQNTDIAPPPV